MPALQSIGGLSNRFFTRLVVIAMNWKPELDQWLVRLFIRFDHASSKGRKVYAGVDVLELERHCGV